MTEHWFWWSMTMACVVWYSTITVYVAVKGVGDIKQMLRRLAAQVESSRDGASSADQSQ